MGFGKKSNDATKKKGVALDGDALENVTGGKVVERTEEEQRSGSLYSRNDFGHANLMFSGDYVLKHKKYDVVDESTGKVVKTFGNEKEAQALDNTWHHRI